MQLEIVEHDAGTFLFHIQLIVTISIKKTGMWIRNVFGNQTTLILYMYIFYKLHIQILK